jgi:hypothetical protein
MQALFVTLALLTASSAAYDVAVTVGGAVATTDVRSLTSVTMDICLAKQEFPFTDRVTGSAF